MGVCNNEGEFVLLSQQVLSEIVTTYLPTCGRGGGLIVSALDSGASGPGSGPGSHGAFLHQMGTSDFNLCAWYLFGLVVRVLALRSGDCQGDQYHASLQHTSLILDIHVLIN